MRVLQSLEASSLHTPLSRSDSAAEDHEDDEEELEEEECDDDTEGG